MTDHELKPCPIKNLCNCDCNICNDEDKTEKINRLWEVVVPIIGNIIQTVFPVIKKAVDKFYCYPNKRVVNLALHHPKERVRKKNIKRIMRWIERESKAE